MIELKNIYKICYKHYLKEERTKNINNLRILTKVVLIYVGIGHMYYKLRYVYSSLLSSAPNCFILYIIKSMNRKQ